MLKLFLLLPQDVVTRQIVPFLDIVSLTRLDSATMSHEHRSSVLTHVFADVTTSEDEVCANSHDLISWVLSRQVSVSRMKFLKGTTDADLAIAAPAIAKSTKVLDLTSCKLVTDEGMQGFLESFDLLHTVTLDNCKQIGDASIDALSRCRLVNLSIKYCPRITEESVLALIEAVGSSLKMLNCRDNDWVTEGVTLSLTKHCPNLEKLCVDGTIVSAAALDYIATHISTKLRYLHITGCSALQDVHMERISIRATYLRSLFIPTVQLTNKALISIGKNLPMLETFYCPHSPLLSHKGFSAFARGCRNVSVLDVSYCTRFCDESLREIVQNCTKLSELRISDTRVSSKSIAYVAEYCVNLTTIAMYSISATEEDVMHLFYSCTKLIRIGYFFNLSNVNKTLRELVSNRRKDSKVYGQAW